MGREMHPENESDRPEPAIENNEEIKPKTKKVRKPVSGKKNFKGKKVSLKKVVKDTSSAGAVDGKSTFQILMDRTNRLFDFLVDAIKVLSKKFFELSKNSNLLDSFSKMLNKTRQGIIRKKDEFSKIHKLNSSIASSKRQLDHHTLSLGIKVTELIEDQKIDPTTSNGLDYLFTRIKDLKQEIQLKEQELKKILND